ncbi:phosphatidate cytidylyltransferase [Caldibacillus lycopersici]|uniref:Phosphatidate cytidylyltransferase n=1 Tax=Perspicuibacillus lycopersici TaxID=1325689 RepID=A0AAE3LRT4_9BACI|nr:phosphatidate cytidylyltransferase [Perspicuibacillus lycopersici]MCU9612073.1 phosphatidate cytidylyltransferase [Perspicuibacillus lycopersici]
MIQRIITAVIAALIFLPLVIIGGIPFIVLIYLMASVALYEVLRMKQIKILSIPGILSVMLLWIFLLPTEYINVFGHIDDGKTEIILFGVLIFLSYSVLSKNRFSFESVGFCMLAVLYLGIGFYYLMATRAESILFVFFALILIWATDSGAYFIGKSFGKRKLWPEISPNKTVEGSVGGIICAIVVALLFFYLTDLNNSFSLVKLLVMSVLLSVFGQLGDLVESALKRFYNVKDSGTLLPGHGGILDRVDSWLFVMPLFIFLHNL